MRRTRVSRSRRNEARADLMLVGNWRAYFAKRISVWPAPGKSRMDMHAVSPHAARSRTIAGTRPEGGVLV